MRDTHAASKVVGIIPAAGQATRLGHLPCSKEILPVGFDDADKPRIVVLSEFLLEEFCQAGIEDLVFAIAPDKRDIQDFFKDQYRGAHTHYVELESPNTPTSVAAALKDHLDQDAAIGFPDTIYGADNAFTKLLGKLDECDADVVLGLYPTEYPDMVDMVKCDAHGRVRDFRIKSDDQADGFDHCWLSAVWRASFSGFLRDNVASLSDKYAAQQQELYLGNVLTAALHAGFAIYGVEVSKRPCLDAGTPSTYTRALRESTHLTAFGTEAYD